MVFIHFQHFLAHTLSHRTHTDAHIHVGTLNDEIIRVAAFLPSSCRGSYSEL